MSILIKGMEMPTDCHNCPLGFGGGCYFGQNADEYMCPDHGRAKWCPLTPVPPHGDLIDADKLVELCDIMADKCDGIGASNWHQFKTTVEWSPIVIPAEEGER